MRFCARQTSAKLTFFSRFCATRRAANRESQLLFGFHAYTMSPLLANWMVNSDQCASPLSLNLTREKSQTSAGDVFRAIWQLALAGSGPMNALLSLFEFIFGCHHTHLSPVFTIKKRTYQGCFECGQEFQYSWELMRSVGSSAGDHWREAPSAKYSPVRP